MMIDPSDGTTYRILFAQERVAVVSQPLYAYFVNPMGIANSENNRIRITRQIIGRRKPFIICKVFIARAGDALLGFCCICQFLLVSPALCRMLYLSVLKHTLPLTTI